MRIVNVAVFSCVLVVASVNSSPVKATPLNIANLKPVIGGSGDYPSNNFNTGGTFATFNVTDGQNALPGNNSGPISEPSQDGSYWLGKDGVTTGYFVLDLLSPFAIGSFEILNTHNAGSNDRGTGQFTIKASNTVVDLGPTLGFNLSGTVVTLASGTLLTEANPNPILPQTFLSSDINNFRYIRFDALTISAPYTQSVGLNELRVFEAPPVPEPSTFALLGLGAIGLALKSRRRRLAA